MERKIYLIDVILIVLLLFNESFFYLFSSTNLTVITSIFSILLGLCGLIQRNKYPKIMICFIVLALIGNVLSICYSTYAYSQGMVAGLGNINRYFIYLSYLFFYPYYSNRDNLNRLLKLIVNISFIIAILCIVQAFLYPKIVFFKDYAVRDGNIRLYAVTSLLSNVSISFLIYEFMKNKKVVAIVKLLTIFLAIVFGFRSRGYIIFTALSIVLSIYLYLLVFGKNKTKSAVKIFSPIIILGIFFVGYLIFDETINSIANEIETSSGSGATRVNELIYYFGCLKENIIFGLGTVTGDLAKDVYGTNLYWYYMEDTGALSVIFKLGIFGIAWLLNYFIIIFGSIKRSLKQKNSFVFVISVYLAVSTTVGIFYNNDIASRGTIFLTVIAMIMLSEVWSKKGVLSNDIYSDTNVSKS